MDFRGLCKLLPMDLIVEWDVVGGWECLGGAVLEARVGSLCSEREFVLLT